MQPLKIRILFCEMKWKTYRAVGSLVFLFFFLIMINVLEVFITPVVSLFVYYLSRIRLVILKRESIP